MRLIPKDTTLGWTPYAWLIYLVPFTLTPLINRRFDTPAGWAMFAGVTLVSAALYFRSFWVSGRELVLVAATMAAIGVAFWPIAHGAGAMFIYAAGMLGYLEPPRAAVFGVAAVTLISVGEAILLSRDWFGGSWPAVFSILIGAINIHYSQVNRANWRLRLAHDEIEHLAKVAERERIARDLHDLLGHTLSLIIIKSELATKLSDRDPSRAREEIRDVERISREALTEVRAAVAGYRSGGIESEIQRARTALTAAGVEVECDLPDAAIPPAHEAVLSLALREAVTNVVRHASARKCSIRLTETADEYRLTVTDDGRGGNAPFGSGLSGMRERVEVLGGTMTRDGARGTALTVTLPLARAQEQTA